MAQGFSVKAGALSVGGPQVAGLKSSVESTASDVVQAITAMAGAASGHAGLASALVSAAESSAKAFLDLGAVYEYVGESLAATASAYNETEQALVASISRIGGGR